MVLFLFIVITVCISTVEKFVNTLTEDVKKDTKKIETAFREFCKSTKSKENRFVSSVVNNTRMLICNKKHNKYILVIIKSFFM